ncbi:DUF2332 domain-containing protein [Demequina sp. NBRC 110057]|uniref:DUF2332 domain-containing protein n=1 Tax=Demequina sp. NBRC 110057 TaxID=1570346 RepID=UPI0009FC219F|nr:DUF2332 domain-containing protein [Demequina sp. NBRC 110057]
MGLDDWAAGDRADLAAVAEEARRWADSASDSPLYRAFALAIADDPALLAVLGRIPGVPPMNLLLGAVKLHLTAADALAAWYPHLTQEPRRPGPEACEALRAYVLDRADALVAEASARRTQTNEVGRAAVLLPWVVAFARDEPVHAVDLGASAGLNLCLDRFAYRYPTAGPDGVRETRLGSSSVELVCEWRGEGPPVSAIPMLASRTGIDLSPVDATDPDAAAWLEALVWPEHTDRLARLRAAIEIRRGVDVTMVAGDAARTLAQVDARLAPGPMVIWHTIALYQAPARVNAAIDAAVEAIARHRPVLRVGMEPVSGLPHSQVRVGSSFDRGRTAATAHAHGRWVAPAYP